MRLKTLFKIFLLFLLTLSLNFTNIDQSTNKIFSVLVIISSIFLLVKSRNNLGLFIMAFFLLYSNYSIAVGEYLVGGDIAAPMVQVKNDYTYGILIRMMLVFSVILCIFIKKQKGDSFKNLELKDNILIFSLLTLINIYILIFGINRNELTTYTVSTKPIYEYSYLFVILSYYFSGDSKKKKAFLVGLVLIFMLQDFYYGGRITSIQLSILLLLTVFSKYFNYMKVLIIGVFGIVLNSFVAIYRTQYSLENINVIETISNLKNNLFVFDTPVFAYYASATHVASVDLLEWNLRLKSFFYFITSLITGSNNDLANVSEYINKNIYMNLGGGVIFSHFYFWLGWAGVILISIILCYLINKFSTSISDLGIILFIIIICTVPRWYLYTPLLLFRPMFIIVILYFIYNYIHKILIYKK